MIEWGKDAKLDEETATADMTNDVATFIADATTDWVELSGNVPGDERPTTDVPADDSGYKITG